MSTYFTTLVNIGITVTVLCVLQTRR